MFFVQIRIIKPIKVRPIPEAPTTPRIPFIAKDWAIEKTDPAATLPTADCEAAAADPAAIPELVNPYKVVPIYVAEAARPEAIANTIIIYDLCIIWNAYIVKKKALQIDKEFNPNVLYFWLQ